MWSAKPRNIAPKIHFQNISVRGKSLVRNQDWTNRKWLDKALEFADGFGWHPCLRSQISIPTNWPPLALTLCLKVCPRRKNGSSSICRSPGLHPWIVIGPLRAKTLPPPPFSSSPHHHVAVLYFDQALSCLRSQACIGEMTYGRASSAMLKIL